MKTPKNITLLVLFSFALFISGYIFFENLSTEALNKTLRITVQVSFLLFTISIGVSSIHYFLKSKVSNWLLKNRKYIGLLAASAFGYHLLIILTKSLKLGDAFSPTIKFQSALFVLAFTAMAITSHQKIIQILGLKKWKVLHLICSFYIAYIFILAYAKKIGRKEHALPFVILIGFMLTLKFLKYIHYYITKKNKGH